MNESYQRLVDSGQLTERQLDVYEALYTHRHRQPEMTAAEINSWLRKRHGGVHGRLRELEAIDMVEVRRQKILRGRAVNVWGLTAKFAR